MHKIFTKSNMATFAFTIAAVAVAVIFVIPIIRKFVPKSLLGTATKTTTTTPSTASP